MQIKVTGRHLKLTDEVRDYINEKAGKLTRFYDRIHEIDVVVDQESEHLCMEMIVRTDHKQTFVAKDSGPDPSVLIDQLTDKLERQLKKHKEKIREHKHDGKTIPTPDSLS